MKAYPAQPSSARQPQRQPVPGAQLEYVPSYAIPRPPSTSSVNPYPAPSYAQPPPYHAHNMHHPYRPPPPHSAQVRPPVTHHPTAHQQPAPQPPSHQPSIFSFAPPEGDRVKLCNRKSDRDTYEDMAAVFSILTATERLENMWARRGAISQHDYEIQCDKLIQQYKVLQRSTEASVPNLDAFIADYAIKANMARHRLKAGIPGGSNSVASASSKPDDVSKFAIQCTTLFHQLANAIDVQQNDVNLLLPDLVNLVNNLSTIVRRSPRATHFDFLDKLSEWRTKLDAMPAHATLSHADAAKLSLDLNTSFNEFARVFND